MRLCPGNNFIDEPFLKIWFIVQLMKATLKKQNRRKVMALSSERAYGIERKFLVLGGHTLTELLCCFWEHHL
jgi:hypothetical protein